MNNAIAAANGFYINQSDVMIAGFIPALWGLLMVNPISSIFQLSALTAFKPDAIYVLPVAAAGDRQKRDNAGLYYVRSGKNYETMVGGTMTLVATLLYGFAGEPEATQHEKDLCIST